MEKHIIKAKGIINIILERLKEEYFHNAESLAFQVLRTPNWGCGVGGARNGSLWGEPDEEVQR